MTLASTSRVQLKYAKEQVFGVTPATGRHLDLRITGETLDYTVVKHTRAKIGTKRAASSALAVSGSAGGTLSGELQYAEYDNLIAGFMQNSWKPYGTDGIGATFLGTYTTSQITAASVPVAHSMFNRLECGQWFTVQGTGTPNDGRLFRVHPSIAPTSTILKLDSNTPATPSSAKAGKISAARLVDGSDTASFTLERVSGDTGEHFTYRGMTPGRFQVNISAGSLSQLDFSFLGKDLLRGPATALPGTVIASRTYSIMSGVAATVCADGMPLVGTYVNSLNLSCDTALTAKSAICELNSVKVSPGQLSVTADLEMYFTSGDLFYSKLAGRDYIELAFTSFDTDGNGYVFTLPKVSVTTYTVTAGGKDQDLMVKVSTAALLDDEQADAARRNVLTIDRIGERFYDPTAVSAPLIPVFGRTNWYRPQRI